MLSRAGSYKLFTFRAIDVYVHWTWFLAAWLIFTMTGGRGWADLVSFMVIYGSLFGIVVLHEFGHALACRSVGGKADLIVLWPLGGVAYVAPPPRPGAVLWSIAAGPLVNVALLPILYGIYFALTGSLTAEPATGFQLWLYAIAHINLVLLVFNMLPIYPLDGGQIVQSILWFFVGRARSLKITAGVGLAAAAMGLLLAITGLSAFLPISPTWLVLISLFIAWQAWKGFQVANVLAQVEAHEQQSIERAMQSARDMTLPPYEKP